MRLDHGEAFNAAIAGLQRQFRAIERNAANSLSFAPKDELATHVHGAIAEAAVAKLLGSYCNSSSKDRRIPDVYPNVEVRSSPNLDSPLIIRAKDPDDRKYYLVVGLYPNIKIVGWIWGHEGKHQDFYQNVKDPYWRISQHDLRHELIEFTDE
jgi:hypothetical protein